MMHIDRKNWILKRSYKSTINDFSTYGNLSRFSVKVSKACPVCEENTSLEY